MSLILITGPTAEPVTVDEVKLDLRRTDTALDTLLAGLITAAREQCEHILGRALMPQTWERVLDAFPGSEEAIELGMPPVTAITSVTYIDADGNSQVLASSAYTLDADNKLPGWLLPARGTTWPATMDTANAVRVRFTCGWANAAAVPESVKTWIRAHVGLWAGCGNTAATAVELKPHPYLDDLLDRWRTWTNL